VLEQLSAKEKVTGLKQTRRAVSAGRARQVYLACDADPRLIEPLQEACREAGVPVENSFTMHQLGRACGIQVGTAAAAVVTEV